MKKITVTLLTVCFFMLTDGIAQHHSGSSYHHGGSTYHRTGTAPSYHHSSSGTHYGHRSNYKYGVQRDSHGRIRRSSSARYEFMKQTGYPHGRKGYVIDHIIPLSKGGCDCPSNMQWQTVEEAKAKDKWERK